MAIFNERLLLCRKKKGISRSIAAQELGLVFITYRRYEWGETEPDVSTAAKIAQYYGVSLDYLAGRTDKENGL